MFKKIITISVLTVALAACETCRDESGTGDCAYEGQFAPGSYEDFKSCAGDRVFFSTNSSHLSSEARSTIARQADWLKQYCDTNVTIEGHCDERGTADYNMGLGERRANSDSKELMANGIDSSRITTCSFGKERPAVEGHNEAAWSQNRRAVTVVNQ